MSDPKPVERQHDDTLPIAGASQAMVARGAPGLRIDQSITLREMAETAARSGFFKDAKQASQAAMKIVFGQELGMGPGASLRGIHVFDGKMELAAATMTSLINQAPNYELAYVEDPTPANKWTCRLRLWRLSKRTHTWEALPESAWTAADTARAGLAGKDNWTKYPAAMSFARCLSQLFRRYCAELGAGPTYAIGEIRDAQDAEFVDLGLAETENGDDLNARRRAAQAETARQTPPVTPPEPTPEPVEAVDAPTIADRIDGGAEIGPPPDPQAAAESAPDDEAAEVAEFIQRLAPDELLDLIKSLEDELAITNKARAGARTEHLGTVILSEARPEPLRQYGMWLQIQRNTQLGMNV